MKVEIREIGDVDNKKRVAFTITSDNQQKYLIDKSVTLSSGKSNDDYIKEAYDLAKTLFPSTIKIFEKRLIEIENGVTEQ